MMADKQNAFEDIFLLWLSFAECFGGPVVIPVFTQNIDMTRSLNSMLEEMERCLHDNFREFLDGCEGDMPRVYEVRDEIHSDLENMLAKDKFVFLKPGDIEEIYPGKVYIYPANMWPQRYIDYFFLHTGILSCADASV
jgi:hypothetical protein